MHLKPTPEVQDLLERMNESRKKTVKEYLATIKRPESFHFTVEGIVRKIEGDQVMMHRDAGLHEIVIGARGPDTRIGYLHWRDLTLELTNGKKERFHYTGTPPHGLRAGDTILLKGWDGMLVKAPSLGFGQSSENVPEYGYIKNAQRPRNVFRIEARTEEGLMVYGPKKFDFPTPPYRGFDDNTIPSFESRKRG